MAWYGWSEQEAEARSEWTYGANNSGVEESEEGHEGDATEEDGKFEAFDRLERCAVVDAGRGRTERFLLGGIGIRNGHGAVAGKACTS
jgi:hypothetical protein